MSFYIPIFKALNNEDIRYVVVGGLATVLHGFSRLTADIDMVIELEQPQSAKAINTLTKLGLKPRLPVSAIDFSDGSIREQWIEDKGMKVFSLWKPDDPLVSVDLFVKYPIEFEALWQDAERVDLGGTTIAIASIPHLIEMKKQANRPQDLQDIEKLTVIEDKKRQRND